MSNQPVARFQIGYVSANVWENQSGDRTFYNVTIQRTFKENGDYQQTGSLGHADILNASRCLQRAEDWISRQ